MKYYFYVPSYNILRQYFYLKQKLQDLTLVSGDKDIIKLAKYMQWEVLDCGVASGDPEDQAVNKFRRLFRFWKRINGNLDFAVSSIGDGTFYFSTLLIDLLGLKLAQRLAIKRTAKVVYLEDLKGTAAHKKLKSISLSQRYTQGYSILLYLLPLKWFDTSCGNFLGVNHSFLKKYGISSDRSPEPFYADVEWPVVPSTTSFDVLIIGDRKIDENKTLWDTEGLKNVYRFIKAIRPDAYFKYHPGMIKNDEICDSFKQVESFIPVEFLYKSIKIAISDYSTSLIGLSLCGVQCIACINLIKTHPGFDKDYWIRFINENSQDKVRFVNSFGELADLLKK